LHRIASLATDARTGSNHQMLCFAVRRTQQVVVLAGEEGFEPSIS
jgi:hypothetical protein